MHRRKRSEVKSDLVIQIGRFFDIIVKMMNELQKIISLAMDIAPHFMPYWLTAEYSNQSSSVRTVLPRSLSMTDLKGIGDDQEITEWADYLKLSLDPIDCIASWRKIRTLQNITCKERLENISWRKYLENDRNKMVLSNASSSNDAYSPSTIHLYFSRGFLNGPVCRSEKQINIGRFVSNLGSGLELSGVQSDFSKRKKKHDRKGIRFKEYADFRYYSNDDHISKLDNQSILETRFMEGKCHLKESSAGTHLLGFSPNNVWYGAKAFIFGSSCRKMGIFDILKSYICESNGKQQKTLPWESTTFIDEMSKSKITRGHAITKRIISSLRGYTASILRSLSLFLRELYQNIANIINGWKSKLIVNAARIRESLSLIFSSVFGKSMKIAMYVASKLYPKLSFLFKLCQNFGDNIYQKLKRIKERKLILIKRFLYLKDPVNISELPTEVKWEILKYLDFKSALKISRLLNLNYKDCLQYHKFSIASPIQSKKFGILSCALGIASWLFRCSGRNSFTLEVNIWTVSQTIERMVGNDDSNFASLVRNKEFLQVINDEILFALSAKYGILPIVKRLLLNPSCDPSSGMDYAVRYAAQKGYTDILAALLKDPRVNPTIDNNKPLISACENGHVNAVDLILKHSKVDPAAKSNHALERACYFGRVNVVKRLLQDRRVDPSASRNYCLKVACKRNHLPVVQILLEDHRVRPSKEDYKYIQRLMKRLCKEETPCNS